MAEEKQSTGDSGRVDELFDELDETLERLDALTDEVETVRRRVEANGGATDEAVRDRVTADADQLGDEAHAAAEGLTDRLQALKRSL
ncbi:MAG: hypothetical protein ABEJ31_11915 [Haloarculaceae archaeon]